ncbi:RNase adapter RapZ [Sphingomonas lenta]|uniref:RNase adapter RapZ n=1 Tax=Sphingomonas lenta TaxID=1141887 RepID=A0A2A2SGP2_9SPHN|nr:RNase adapter RapZ [Sphingomonas lenta]PAX08427.1 RNase adapter RapZ [Sphingomonas lenta]
MSAEPRHVLLVTGMSGAGKLTVLRTLEDMGWEVVDNLPLNLLRWMLRAPMTDDGEPVQPLAVSLGAHTRAFDSERLIDLVTQLNKQGGYDVGTLFLDCGTPELERRYSETRRRHPLALDRPAVDGIEQEREILEPLRRWANRLIDTTALKANELQADIRAAFGGEQAVTPTLTVVSFGFSRGLPRNADLVFDMRFLRNPHWVPGLREGTGLDAAVVEYIRNDPAYEDTVRRIEELLCVLVPRYGAGGKSYVTIAIGCTGGKHRSVHVADRVARRLREAGFSPTLLHRDLRTAPQDSLTRSPPSAT